VISLAIGGGSLACPIPSPEFGLVYRGSPPALKSSGARSVIVISLDDNSAVVGKS